MAADRRPVLEEAGVEARGEDKMVVKPIDARTVFDEEYPPGSEARARMDAHLRKSLDEHARRMVRSKRTKSL